MSNVKFVFGAILMVAGILAVGSTVVMADSIKIQMGLGEYALASKFGFIAVLGFLSMISGYKIMDKNEG